MAKIIPPDAVLKLREDTLQEVYLLIEAVWNLVALAVNPWPPSDAPEAMKLYTGVIASASRDIAKSMVVLYTDSFPATHDLLYTLVTTVLGKTGATIAKDYDALLQGLFSDYDATLTAHKTNDPAKVNALVAKALEQASALGLGSRAVTLLFELFLPKKLNFMNWLGPTLAGLSGYDEIIKLTRAPQLEASIGTLARYKAHAEFKTEAPKGPDARRLYARRLIKAEQRDRLEDWSGAMPEFREASQEGSYTSISARALTPLADDNDFDLDQFRDLLRFNGNREKDIALMVRAFEARKLKSVRSAARAAAIAFFEAGLMDQPDLDSYMDAIQANTDEHALVKEAALFRRLITVTATYKLGWDESAGAGDITIVQYHTALSGLGYIDPILSAYVAATNDKMNARGFKAAIAADAKVKHDREHLALQSAMLAFKNGEIDRKKLLALLLAAGFDAVTAALYVALAYERGHHKKPVIKA